VPCRRSGGLLASGLLIACGVSDERIAATVWGARISPLFEVSERALLLTVENGRPIERSEVALPSGGWEAKLGFLRGLGVDTVLCGAMSRTVAERADALRLRVVSFLAGEIEEVLDAYLQDRLPSKRLTMPGWRSWTARNSSGGRAS
jgi:predicted Fe-Mo cluster-binding NifX family protein